MSRGQCGWPEPGLGRSGSRPWMLHRRLVAFGRRQEQAEGPGEKGSCAGREDLFVGPQGQKT
jgi:hypothetical protein